MSHKQRLDAIEKRLVKGSGGYIPAEELPELAGGRYDKQDDGTWVLTRIYASGETLTDAEYQERLAKQVAELKRKHPGKKIIWPFTIIEDNRPIELHED